MTLLIIFTTIGSVISGAALLPSYNLSEVAAQQAGSNAQLSLSMLKQKGVPLLGSPSAHITIIEGNTQELHRSEDIFRLLANIMIKTVPTS
jgi:hypothetical protein